MKNLQKIQTIVIILLLAKMGFAQIGINATGSAPATNAMLDVSSTTKGLLIPRMTTAQRNTLLATATDGLTVYDIDTKGFWFYNATTTAWTALATGGPWLGAGNDINNTNIGNVGIGTNIPTGKLHISAIGVANSTSSVTGSHIKMTLTDDAKWGWTRFESQSGSKSFSHRYDLFSNLPSAVNYSIYYNTTQLFTITGDGRVGIGISPTYPLDIAGDINTTANLRVSGNAGLAGDILKKDASNVMSWQPQFTGFSAKGTAPAVSNSQFVPTGINLNTQITVLNNEEYDTNTMYNPATGDITIPSAGIYHIDIKLHIDNADIGLHTLTLQRTPLGLGPQSIRFTNIELTANNVDYFLVISSDLKFTANDVLKIIYNHNCATDQEITGSFYSWVNMHKLN
jgi:hypothetical protein